jgi:hypothetical protein
LSEIVEFAGKKIVLFGDFVADEFQSGEISAYREKLRPDFAPSRQ